MSFSQLLIWSAYLVVVFCALVASMFVSKRRRKGRFPLGDDIRLMRQAGEHLSQELERLNGTLLNRYIWVMFLPAVGFILPRWIVVWWAPTNHLGVAVASVALAFAGLVGGISSLLLVTKRFSNTRLGLFGERFVADCLEPLKVKGYEIFHDVPCMGATGPFNLDHVVVGGGAVTVVETKTRRKAAPPGVSEYKVTYDGKQLLWPQGPSQSELRQVTRNAAWLAKELKANLDLDVGVHSALTLPGWFVTANAKAPVVVQNPTNLKTAIFHQCRGPLTPEQMTLIGLRMRRLCTTVEYETM